MQTTVEDKAASILTGALSLANQSLDIEERAKSLAEKTSEVKPSAEEKMVAETSERLVLDDREESEQERKTKVTVQLEQQNNQLEGTGEIFKIINQQLPEVKTQQSSEPVPIRTTRMTYYRWILCSNLSSLFKHVSGKQWWSGQ